LAKVAAIAATIIIVIIAIVGGLFYYSYTQIHVSLNDVRFHSIDWTTFSWSTLFNLGLNALTGKWLDAAFELIDGVNLNLIFGLSNYGFLPVYIPDLSYDLYVNGEYVGAGHTSLDATIYPGETREITAFQNFKKSSLSPAVSSIVSEGGVMYIYVKGTAYFQLLGLSIPIPFESSKQISIVDEIKIRLNSEIQKHEEEERRAATARAAEVAAAAKAAANAAVNVALAIGESLYEAADSLLEQLFGPPPKIKTYLELHVPEGKVIHEGDVVTIWGFLYWMDDNTSYGVPNSIITILDSGITDEGLLPLIGDVEPIREPGYFELHWKTLPRCMWEGIKDQSNRIEDCGKHTGSTDSQFKLENWNLNAIYPGDSKYEPVEVKAKTFYVKVTP